MNDRFTKRLSSLPEESLTGYLMRMGEENGYKISGLLKLLNISFHDRHQLDILPQKVVDLEKLCYLLGLSKIKIEDMTFLTLLKKFYSQISEKDADIGASVRSIFIKDRRRFCVSCLNEKSPFKLIWQISDIKICNIHYTKLQSMCENCSSNIPYLNNFVGKYVCYRCGFKFNQQDEEKIDDINLILEQEKIYNDYNFLLNNKFENTNTINGLSIEKRIAASFLFFNKKSNYYKSKERHLYNLILDKTPSMQLSPNMLLKMLNPINVTLEQFFNFSVPQSFVQEIILSQDKAFPKKPGICLAPWCKSYKTSSKMRVLKKGISINKHYMVCICSECMMKYGYNRKNRKWETIDNRIELIMNIIVPNTNMGTSLRKITENCNIRYSLLIDLITYCLNYNLIKDEKYFKNIPHKMPKDLVSIFRRLKNLNGKMQANAHKVLGWSDKEYYYYLNTPEVQRFLLFDLKNKNKEKDIKKSKLLIQIDNAINRLIESEEPITIKRICKKINCSKGTLYNYGMTVHILQKSQQQKKPQKSLKENSIRCDIEKYLESITKSGKFISMKKIFNYLKISKSFFVKNYPELFLWLKDKIKFLNSEIKNNRKTTIKGLIIKAVKDLNKSNLPVNKISVAKYLGFHYRRFNSDPFYKECYNDAINSLD